MALSESDLAEIRRLHQACEQTLDEIGARFGMAGTMVSKLARAQGWPSRSELIGRASRLPGARTTGARARLVRRLYAAAGTMLKQMEAEMRGGNLKAQDFERIGKSMAAVMGSLGKVTTTGPDGDQTQTSSGAEPGAESASDDVERLQREIIERFERIQKRRSAEAGPE